MANLLAGSNVWLFTGFTGGSPECLDWAGSGPDAIREGDTAKVYDLANGQVYDYVLRNSGATPVGREIIEPVVEGHGDLRWHLFATATVTTYSKQAFAMPYFACEDGLANEELYRWNLQSGEMLSIWRVELPMENGGASADVSIDVYDATTDTVLASVTAGGVASGDPIATSGDGSTVQIRITNSSGAVVNVGYLIEYRIEPV